MTVALIVGHSSAKSGATNLLGESEYDFNKRIAFRVKDILKDQIVVLLKDNYISYNEKLTELKPLLAIELHFNSFREDAYGCEALLINDNEKLEVNALLYLISKRFDLRNRGIKYTDPRARGYTNLMLLRSHCKKSFILEPCFRNEAEVFNNEQEYALLLADFLRDYIPKQVTEESTPWKTLLQSLWALLRFLKDNSKVKTL